MIDVSLACVGIKNSGNLGALARLCDNFNLDSLYAINPECSVDSEAYIRSTKGKAYLDSLQILNKISDLRGHTDLIVGLSSRFGGIQNLARPAISIQELKQQLSNMTGSLVLLLGREDSGLTNLDVAECDILVHIPIPSDNPVLNISHAAAVALWELYRNDNFSSLGDTHRLMKHAEKDKFIEYLSEILPHAWIEEDKHQSIIRVFSTILSRSMVNHREASALVGTIRAIHKTIMQGHPPRDNCDQK